MYRLRMESYVVLGAALLAACSDQSTPSAPSAAASFAVASNTGGGGGGGGTGTIGATSPSCPATPAFVVTTESTLRDAVAAAGPGAVIAIRGMIGIGADLIITTPSVRLTCATPGSGLFAVLGNPDFLFLIQALAPGVAVDNLVLDASALGEGPYFGTQANLRFSNNIVTCGAAGGECPLWDAAPGVIVTNNTFTANGTGTGVHLQNGIDGARIQGNVVIATAPSTGAVFGGIRARDGKGVVIADNVVIGPWFNSLSVTFLEASQITSNRFEGGAAFGMFLGLPGSFRLVRLRGNSFRSNRATGAGLAGLYAAQSCNNVFVGNNLQGNAGGLDAVFDTTSGANTLVATVPLEYSPLEPGCLRLGRGPANAQTVIRGRDVVAHFVIAALSQRLQPCLARLA